MIDRHDSNATCHLIPREPGEGDGPSAPPDTASFTDSMVMSMNRPSTAGF